MDSDILIVGTGALASLFAARLAASGLRVTMLGTWQAGLDALRQEGVRLLGQHDRTQTYHVRVSSDPSECQGICYALVLVKAWQTDRAAAQLARCLVPDGLALTLQNGVGNREILAQALGTERVALGVTTTGATLLGPGLVRPGGDGTVSIESQPRLGPLEQMLRAADFQVELVPDARSLMWGKLVINAAINPLTALLRVPNGVLLERPTARRLMADLAGETAAVAEAQEVLLPFQDAVRAAEDVARRTAANHSSMFQDVRRGAPTEIDAICGEIVKVGRQHGVPVPVNEFCWNLVKATYTPT